MNLNPLSALKAQTRLRAAAATVLLVTTCFTAACDSDGNSSETTGAGAALATALFSGTVSTPQGIAEPQISLKSPDGTVTTTAVDELGQFTLDSSQLEDGAIDRYLMRADLGNDNYMYSLAYLPDATGNRQNIHSYTDLVARTWFADRGADINSVFASRAGIEDFPSSEAIGRIDANVQAIVSDALQVYGLSSVSLSDAFYVADGTGIDRFLNENPVIIRDDRATIIVNDPNTNLQATAVNSVRLTTSFSAIDVTAPEQPQDLRALGSSSGNVIDSTTGSNAGSAAIVLAWSIASDNIGVATYEINREDELIGHTPFPFYRDTDVQPDTDYNYTVVTVDESGNRSIPSLQETGRTLSVVDTTSPAAPSSATLNANTQRIDIFWAHNDITDLARFEVTRTGGDGILVREVTEARLSDITVASGTQYCYTIVAVDASGNRSDPNPRACMTTSGSAVSSSLSSTGAVPATVELAQDSISGPEDSVITAYVNRLGDADGEISIDYIITPGTATAEEDFVAPDGTLVWTDGDMTAKQIDISLLRDALIEGSETFSIVLSNSSTDAVITNAVTIATIIDINQ